MITTINEFRKFYEMHGEQNFNNAVISSIEKEYPDLITNKKWDELKSKIEIDWPSLSADAVIQYWTDNDIQFKVGDRIFVVGMEPGTRFSETEFHGTIKSIDYEAGTAQIQYDDKPEGELIEEEIEDLQQQNLLKEAVIYTLQQLKDSPTNIDKIVKHILDYLGEKDQSNISIKYHSDVDFDILGSLYFSPISVIIYETKPEIEIHAQNTAPKIIKNPFFDSLNENNISYYQELVNADRQRLKNATGGEAEMIQQNLNFNLKKLNQLKRTAKNKIPETPAPKTEPETYKKGDKVSVYIDGYWQPGTVIACYDDTDFKNPVEINTAIQGENHSVKVKTYQGINTYGVDGLNVGYWNRQLKK